MKRLRCRVRRSDLFDKARSAAHNLVVCEVNSDPDSLGLASSAQRLLDRWRRTAETAG